MSDRNDPRVQGEFADDRGNVYDIEGDHVEENPVPNPRDTVGEEPAAGYMGGGAGGIATSGFDTTADMEDSELRAASESGIHGSVAESADLGQRPLRDYKRDADSSRDATDTTMSAGRGSTGPVDTYVSDADAVDRPLTAAAPVESRAVAGGDTGRMAGGSSGGSSGNSENSSGERGRVILDTANDQFDESSGTVRDASDRNAGRTTRTTTTETTTGTMASGSGMGTDRSSDRSGSGGGSGNLDNDDTSPLGDISTTETLDNVQRGYKVIDASGDEIGKVRDLKAGDASAATVDDASESTGETGVFAVPGGTGTGGGSGLGSGAGLPGVVGFGDAGEPNVNEPEFSRLSRIGFIKIDSSGWFTSDRYAGANQIDRVEDETVYLNVGKDDLISER